MSDFETVREFLGYIDYREHQDGNPWEALRMIEDRLRDAEERAAVKEPLDYIEGLEARLAAALDAIHSQDDIISDLQARLAESEEAERNTAGQHLALMDRLSAAVDTVYLLRETEEQLKRAEKVVEAAKRARDGVNEDLVALWAAIRHYEEGKK